MISDGQPDVSSLNRMLGGIIVSGGGADTGVKCIVIIQEIPDQKLAVQAAHKSVFPPDIGVKKQFIVYLLVRIALNGFDFIQIIGPDMEGQVLKNIISESGIEFMLWDIGNGIPVMGGGRCGEAFGNIRIFAF